MNTSTVFSLTSVPNPQTDSRIVSRLIARPGFRISNSRSLYSRGVRLKRVPAARDAMASRVELHIGDLQAHGLRNRTAAAHRAQPGQQDVDRKRLGQVVVRAGIEARHDIGRGIARGQHQHGCLIALLAQFPGDGHAVHAGQRDIQQDHVESRRPGDVETLVAVPCQHHLMAFFAQGSLQEFGHPPFVLDHQNLHAP